MRALFCESLIISRFQFSTYRGACGDPQKFWVMKYQALTQIADRCPLHEIYFFPLFG